MSLLLAGIFALERLSLAENPAAKIRTPLRRRDTPSLLNAALADESCIDPAIRGKCSVRQGAAASATAAIASIFALARPLTTTVSSAV